MTKYDNPQEWRENPGVPINCDNFYQTTYYRRQKACLLTEPGLRFQASTSRQSSHTPISLIEILAKTRQP